MSTRGTSFDKYDHLSPYSFQEKQNFANFGIPDQLNQNKLILPKYKTNLIWANVTELKTYSNTFWHDVLIFKSINMSQ